MKNKILTILPYWLIAISLIISVQGGVFLITQPKFQAQAQQIQIEPQVLGTSTSVRGEPEVAVVAPKMLNTPDYSKITAKSFLVFDLSSGKNLLEKNTAQKLGIASITKLLTGLVAYNSSDLNSNFQVKAKSAIKVNPVLGLIPGDEVKALDVFNAMLVGSNNDAALALANFVSGSNESFVTLMNRQAQDIGMSSSNFANPLGFDSDENYSTATDLKLLITKTESLAAFSNLGRRTSYDFVGKFNRNYHAVATNKLIARHPDISAIKTGHTENSGGAMATKIEKNGHEIVILVLGSTNREQDTLKLKNLVETGFDWN
ncbi:MAG: serine hydrolase [Candidatus Doudnabacteria bacterium]